MTTRRRALAGLGAAATLGALEYASLRGAFDHRRLGSSPAAERYAASTSRLAGERRPAVVHIAHSTHLLSVAGTRLLTDPWFYDPAFGALSHAAPPATSPEGIGALDAILVTHDHPDHADFRAIDRLDKNAVFFAPTAVLAAQAKARGFRHVEVLGVWDTATVGGVRVTAVPAEHDVYEIGYVVEGDGHTLYFAGDTRLFDGMHQIADRYRPSLAILPVDGTRIAGGPLSVMTPDDAVRAASMLRPTVAMPSHAEAYFSDPLAKHLLASSVPLAIDAFARAMRNALPEVVVVVPAPGDCVFVPPLA